MPSWWLEQQTSFSFTFPFPSPLSQGMHCFENPNLLSRVPPETSSWPGLPTPGEAENTWSSHLPLIGSCGNSLKFPTVRFDSGQPDSAWSV